MCYYSYSLSRLILIIASPAQLAHKMQNLNILLTWFCEVSIQTTRNLLTNLQVFLQNCIKYKAVLDYLSMRPLSTITRARIISLSYKYKRPLYSTDKTSTCCKSAEKPPLSFLPFGEILGLYHGVWCNFVKPYFTHHWTSHRTAGRKAPSPDEGKFLTLDLSISGNFQQLWFLWQKSPPPPYMRENFLTLDISFSGNFQQLWFLWQKSPPPHEGKFFDTGSIHFRQFPATLVFVAE